MFCDFCGEPLENGVKYCPGCGRPVKLIPSVNRKVVQPMPDIIQEAPKKKTPIIIAVVVLVILLIAAVMVTVIFVTSGNEDGGNSSFTSSKDKDDEEDEKEEKDDESEEKNNKSDEKDEKEEKDEKNNSASETEQKPDSDLSPKEEEKNPFASKNESKSNENDKNSQSKEEEKNPFAANDRTDLSGLSEEELFQYFDNDEDIFIFPNSATVKLTDEDMAFVKGNKRVLALARNEIFARYGYRFTVDPMVIDYFNKKKWYQGLTKIDSYDYNDLSDVEKSNIDIIQRYEDEAALGN